MNRLARNHRSMQAWPCSTQTCSSSVSRTQGRPHENNADKEARGACPASTHRFEAFPVRRKQGAPPRNNTPNKGSIRHNLGACPPGCKAAGKRLSNPFQMSWAPPPPCPSTFPLARPASAQTVKQNPQQRWLNKTVDARNVYESPDSPNQHSFKQVTAKPPPQPPSNHTHTHTQIHTCTHTHTQLQWQQPQQ